MLVAAELSSLDDDGYVVLDRLLDDAEVAAMRAAIEVRLEIDRRDPTKRHGGTLHLDLIDAGEPLERAWNAPRLRAAVEHVLGPSYRLDVASYRGPRPGYGAQSLHTDDVALRRGNPFRVVAAIVALTDFHEDNGATRLVPGSHLAPLHDAPRQPDRAHPRQRVISAPAGSALVFNGHIWHSGTRNATDVRRDSLQIVFRRV